MVCEIEFLSRKELFQFDRKQLDAVAFPVGDRYPEEIVTNYFAWYGGMVRKFRPTRFLEIGVRYGYTGIVCCLAAASPEPGPSYRLEYRGIDDESYPPAPGVRVGSCTKANENFKAAVPFHDAIAVKWNSMTQGLPPGIGTFDMIHIDGNHTGPGVLNDLDLCWPILNEGGFILLDDTQFPEIKGAIETWLAAFTEVDEILAVQWVDNERGHAYIAKTGLRASQTPDLARALKDRGYV